MISIILTILNDQIETIDNIKFSISWKTKSDLVNDINRYIKLKKLIKFYPIQESSFVIYWDSIYDYEMFLLEENYQSAVSFLKTKGINLIWSEMVIL